MDHQKQLFKIGLFSLLFVTAAFATNQSDSYLVFNSPTIRTAKNGMTRRAVPYPDPAAPILIVSPDTLEMGATTTQGAFTIANVGDDTLKWQAKANPDCAWIVSIEPNYGTLIAEAATQVSVTIDRTDLTLGEYSSHILITSEGGTRELVVKMTVTAGPRLVVAPDTLDFDLSITTLSFSISNRGSDTLIWQTSAEPPESWITSINPTRGELDSSTSQIVSVAVNRNDLIPGNYTSTIPVTSNGGSAGVFLKMKVLDQPHLLVAPIELDFGKTLTNLSFTITNSGGGTLNWNATENPDESWLALVGKRSGALSAGQTTTVEINVSRSGLPQGIRYGEILVTSNGRSHPIDVTVDVGRPPTSPECVVSPTVLDFSNGLTELTLTIKNRGSGTLQWSASQNPQQTWISTISPNSGSLNAMQTTAVTVQVSRSGLNDGFYSGMIGVNSNGGNSNVAVEMIVGPRPTVIRANVGGEVFTDHQQNYFSADRPYHAGAWGHVRGHYYHITNNIHHTENDPLYQTELFWLDSYRFDLTNGFYTVILHFAELYYNYNNGRVFSTKIENQLVLDHFDINQQVGFRTATTRTFSGIVVTDGRLDIDFEHHKAHAKLSAIEVITEALTSPILAVSPTELNLGNTACTAHFNVSNRGNGVLEWFVTESPDETWITAVTPASGRLDADETATITVTVNRADLEADLYTGQINVTSNGGTQAVTVKISVPTTPKYTQRVNCGSSSEYTDDAGQVWAKDQAYTSGQWGYVRGNIFQLNEPIANTTADPLYQTERWGMTSYRFDLENGDYEVNLCFAEIYFNAAGQRVFHVEIEKQRVLADYDIFAEAGPRCATNHVFQIPVKDGQLNINFIKHIDDPKISAIQIKAINQDETKNSKSDLIAVEVPPIPTAFALHQNYPNPFTATTTIAYDLPFVAAVKLRIFNILGQIVYSNENDQQLAGRYTRVWNNTTDRGLPVPSGIYFYQIEIIPDESRLRKIILTRKMTFGK